MLSCDEQYMVPTHALIRQLQQVVEALFWEGNFQEATLQELYLNEVVSYSQKTGNSLYPMF